jgi:hypothetical protein
MLLHLFKQSHFFPFIAGVSQMIIPKLPHQWMHSHATYSSNREAAFAWGTEYYIGQIYGDLISPIPINPMYYISCGKSWNSLWKLIDIPMGLSENGAHSPKWPL